jgi:hypothetical protein
VQCRAWCSLIVGTKTELQVKKWKEHNCHAYRESVNSDDVRTGGTLGISYWRQFLPKKTSTWLGQKEHPEPLWRNKNGEVTESEDNAFGLASK